MSLFYENKKQDLKGEFVYEIDSKRDYAFRNKLVMEVDGYEYEKDAVIIKFIQKSALYPKSREYILSTFHKDELEKFIKDLSMVNDKLENNMNLDYIDTYGSLRDLFYAIMENYHNYHNETGKVPQPKLSIYMDDGETYFSAVDLRNNKIIMNNKINLDDKLRSININPLIRNIEFTFAFNSIVEIITMELMECVYSNGRTTDISYIVGYASDGHRNACDEVIIREYIHDNLTIEDGVFKPIDI